MDSRTPMNGIRLVAKAWTDPAFKARLLAEPKTVIQEWGIDLDKSPELMIVENTPTVHNVIVCTLCPTCCRARRNSPAACVASASATATSSSSMTARACTYRRRGGGGRSDARRVGKECVRTV